MEKEWFSEWFDSPYYHILYKNRDELEARQFIDRLLDRLNPAAGARMLDLACGKGRYSRYLASKGYGVTGLDLSPQSIAFARQFESENLAFYTHDMRQVFWCNYFDYVFNFFTSFGYFENEKDHLRTLKNVANCLKPGGEFVLDFFNSVKVLRELPPLQEKTVDGVHFKLEKTYNHGHIYKKIELTDGERKEHYTERVRAFFLPDFEALFATVGLGLEAVYGDYHLGSLDLYESDRLILVAKKA